MSERQRQEPGGEMVGSVPLSQSGVDPLLTRFFLAQQEAAMALAADSDLLELEPLALNRYRASFDCETLLETSAGVRRERTQATVEIWLPRSYLRRVVSMQVITVLGPTNLFLANVKPPLCCIGPIRPSTPVTEILARIWDVLSGQNVMPDEFDALNSAACAWIRTHAQYFPLDTRPLKRSSRPAAEHVYTPLDENADQSGWELG